MNIPVWRLAAAGAAALLLALLAIVFFRHQEGSFAVDGPQTIHYAGDENRPLALVRVLAFYFVPSDAAGRQDENWHRHFEEALDATRQFYQSQLHDSVAVSYEIYPQPVLGLNPSLFYDGENTGRGNPHALKAVRQELLTRAFERGGDMFDSRFARQDGAYTVLSILYEGVGSSASMFAKTAEQDSHLIPLGENEIQAFLVSRYYLTGSSYTDYGQSVFAHEFGHMLGLADNYGLTTGKPTSGDIMGSGRFKPLSQAYLSLETKKTLGANF